jgi:hypothetical protein
MCLNGADVQLAPDITRINLPFRTARVIARVELGKDKKQAVWLQHQIQIRMTGTPRIDPVPATPPFANSRLPGVEAFDSATVGLDSEPDINPGMVPLQVRVRQIAADVATSPAQRERVDRVIRDKAIPQLATAGGSIRNGWTRPAIIGQYGNDYKARTQANLAGNWANVVKEVAYFDIDADGTSNKLNSANTYTMTFPKGALPRELARYFWSLTAVESVDSRVMENPKKRYLLNSQSRLRYGSDGSLTLYFAPERPAGAPDGNWLPTPGRQDYKLTFHAYGPDPSLASDNWYPPPVVPGN